MSHLRIRYSLRVFLLLLTAISIWLGVRANAANAQRRAVEVISRAGGDVLMDWQMQPYGPLGPDGTPDYYKILRNPDAIPGPDWLRRLVGDDYFQQAVRLSIHPDKVVARVADAIQSLPKLTSINLTWEESDPQDAPKMTREKHDALVDQIETQNPHASVWSRGL